MRWDEGAQKLQRDGVKLLEGDGTLAGWLFIEHASLGEPRVEMLRTSLTAEKLYQVPELKKTVVRLFLQIHVSERAPPSRFSRSKRFQVREVALESENEELEEYEGLTAEEEEWDEEADPDHYQEVFMAAVEDFAQELDEADFEDLDEEEKEMLEDAALTLHKSSEALETVKAFRERRKGARPKGGQRRPMAKSKGGPRQVGEGRKGPSQGFGDPPTAPPWKGEKEEVVAGPWGTPGDPAVEGLLRRLPPGGGQISPGLDAGRAARSATGLETPSAPDPRIKPLL